MRTGIKQLQLWLLGALWLGGSSPQTLGGTIHDVQHVVILMQENRSFDHYFGTLQGVRGFNDPNIRLFQNGSSDLFQPDGTNFILPFPLTNDCNYGDMGYYTRTNLPFYYALADAYTICDANYCSVAAPTFRTGFFCLRGRLTRPAPVADRRWMIMCLPMATLG